VTDDDQSGGAPSLQGKLARALLSVAGSPRGGIVKAFDSV